MLIKNKGLLSVFLGCFFLISSLNAQVNYDIRLEFNYYDTLEKMTYYNVQLRSSGDPSWGLAGQNYRLFYDASKVGFRKGFSKLPNAYQQFQLVQHVAEVDASSINGEIDFAKTLGFINFSIDLSDTYNGGVFLPDNGEWITTASLVFEDKCERPKNCLQAIWARDGKTNAYATSFVEISNWQSTNTTQSATGKNYFDLILPKSITSISIRLFLQGAFEENNDLMRDDIRKKGYLPLVEPYSLIKREEETLAFKVTDNKRAEVDRQVFEDRGMSSIVDWILIEIRNEKNPAILELAKVGLLQRDGYVVDIDGVSPIFFRDLPDYYYLAIRHRNHLGVMCKKPLTKETKEVDFSNPQLAVFGKNARKRQKEVMLLWAGNADSNQFLSFQGGGNIPTDVSTIFWEIISDTLNSNHRINHIKQGYTNADINMDGTVRYIGPENDVFSILLSIIQYPDNYLGLSNYLVKENLPE